MNKRIFIIVSFLILAISLLDIKVIPFYKKLGLDFSNQYGFHHCEAAKETIYKIATSKCPDFEARPYVYPPLLYQLFSWTRMFTSNDSAYSFFVLLHVISFLLVVSIWAEKKVLPVLFGLGLFVTFPNLFLMERGNSDMFIVLLWSLAFKSYQSQKIKTAGFFLAISVFAKLYPVFALVVLAAFFIRKHPLKIRLFQSFTATAALVALTAPYLWFEYLVDVLPKWSGEKTPIYNLSHSLKSIPLPAVGTLIFFTILLFWVMAALKASEKRLEWVWAGGLAISTFQNGVSFDYNLVSTFPLAIVAFNYLSQNTNKIMAITFSLFFFGLFGSRAIFLNVDSYPLIRLVMLGLCLLIIPFIFFDLSHEFKRVWHKLKFIFLNRIQLLS